MNTKTMKRLALAAAVAAPLLATGVANAELKIPSLDYRTGPYAPNGIPFANGFSDYLTLLNERDGVLAHRPHPWPAWPSRYYSSQKSRLRRTEQAPNSDCRVHHHES